jgi:hypothetical protein
MPFHCSIAVEANELRTSDEHRHDAGSNMRRGHIVHHTSERDASTKMVVKKIAVMHAQCQQTQHKPCLSGCSYNSAVDKTPLAPVQGRNTKRRLKSGWMP